MDYNLPGSSVHGIFQARILEWVAISFSVWIFLIQGSNPGSRLAGRHFTISATRGALEQCSLNVWIFEELPNTTFLSIPHLITTKPRLSFLRAFLNCRWKITPALILLSVSKTTNQFVPDSETGVFITWSSLWLHPLKKFLFWCTAVT